MDLKHTGNNIFCRTDCSSNGCLRPVCAQQEAILSIKEDHSQLYPHGFLVTDGCSITHSRFMTGPSQFVKTKKLCCGLHATMINSTTDFHLYNLLYQEGIRSLSVRLMSFIRMFDITTINSVLHLISMYEAITGTVGVRCKGIHFGWDTSQLQDTMDTFTSIQVQFSVTMSIYEANQVVYIEKNCTVYHCL